MAENEPGTVYILCFDDFKGVKHYIGWAKHLQRRINHHKNGSGACLTRAVVAANIPLEVSRTFPNQTRAFERAMKNQHNHKRFCPNCRYKTGEPVRNPVGYVETRRKYKAIPRDGFIQIIESKFKTVRDLFACLAKRTRVGDIILFNKIKYERVTKRKYSHAFVELPAQQELPGVLIEMDAEPAAFGNSTADEFNLREIAPSARELSKPPLRPFNEPGADYFEDIPF